jgi:hypothetical protein
MRIFILGAGATGSLLAHVLTRQGHQVWCGDKDPARAQRFLGKRSRITVKEVNARNLRSVVRAARGCHLLVNCLPAVFNKTALRAALRLKAHYLDTASHLTGYPFQVEQLRFDAGFRKKRRTAVINAGAAPGLTNLLVARTADLLDVVETVQVRLYENTDSDDPVSQWSPDSSFDEAISRPRVYRNGRFHLGPRFGEREVFRFPPPIGPAGVMLAAQDEVCTLPRVIPMRALDVKIGGNDFERLRRWYRLGRLRKSRGLPVKHFTKTPTPRQVARLLHHGRLWHARFAAAVVAQGVKGERYAMLRWDAGFPSLHQLRRRGRFTSPIAWATAHMAALFIRHFPRELAGVYPPEALPREIQQAVLSGARAYGIRLTKRIKLLAPIDHEE